MQSSQLEAIVLQAVGQLISGLTPEDDRVEFKRDWPGPDKARQLAGAANRADGDMLIYVIGVDEKSRAVVSPKAVDPATWWAQMEASFDEVTPELERHLNVVVSEGQSVVALLFRTDRSPYVVKLLNSGPTEREVPIRAGTRTRSAHRHELLRLLYPTVQVPQLSAVGGRVSLGSSAYGGDEQRVVDLDLWLQLFVEHVQPEPAFLPAHMCRATLLGTRHPKQSGIYWDTSDQYSQGGILRRSDGLEVFGSGATHVRASWKFNASQVSRLGARDDWKVALSFAVAGTDRHARLELHFGDKTSETREARISGEKPRTTYTWSIGMGRTGN
ncbi:hypothetical protein BH09ACT4_BH09ACT4_16720 [soil metagenome]